MIKTLVFGLLLTAFSAKGGAFIVKLVGTHLFGASDTILVQWVVAGLIGAVGFAATAHEVVALRHQKGQAA